jgi:hypothetical protein
MCWKERKYTGELKQEKEREREREWVDLSQ